jgi:toxin ParE1/3/4
LSEYRLKPRAIADLDEIWDFTVERWSEAQAERYILGLRDDFDMLADQPLLGRPARICTRGCGLGSTPITSFSTPPPSGAST